MSYDAVPPEQIDERTWCETHGWSLEPCECDARDAAGLDPVAEPLPSEGRRDVPQSMAARRGGSHG